MSAQVGGGEFVLAGGSASGPTAQVGGRELVLGVFGPALELAQ
ncbi:hypothetical protein B005_3479 [Nocardiopsis alba ATCC BAA-2165]|uniref:Uncharacterized protein n=1 Tax=Nocardiopsis alba (strain ATCC BAA-2165 / BE74) TaxID=1205910 RepID=J7LEN9_NOCAA|nr:hypothetical protein B005_3479 [Nocardiopsis alba ATCC BAA-2165]